MGKTGPLLGREFGGCLRVQLIEMFIGFLHDIGRHLGRVAPGQDHGGENEDEKAHKQSTRILRFG